MKNFSISKWFIRRGEYHLIVKVHNKGKVTHYLDGAKVGKFKYWLKFLLLR